MNTGGELLRLTGLCKSFGGVVVADNVNLALGPTDLRSLIGPNGAGKSTLVNLVTGFLKPDSGAIRFDGQDVTRWGPARRRHAGIARTFQTARVIPDATVFGNVLLAYRSQRSVGSLLRTWRVAPAEHEAVEHALSRVEMTEMKDGYASDLPHGQKRLLEIAMAIVEPPRLLLLDEPTAGMSIRETEEVAEIIDNLRGQLAMLVIDHDMIFIRRLGVPTTVLHRGVVVREGTIDELENDEYVRDIYLGVPESV